MGRPWLGLTRKTLELSKTRVIPEAMTHVRNSSRPRRRHGTAWVTGTSPVKTMREMMGMGGHEDGEAGTGAAKTSKRFLVLFFKKERASFLLAPPQAAIFFRSRRKWKNSTPSRRRRFIIWGLRIISLTMEAIFGARK